MISFFSWIRFDQILDAGYKNLWNFSAMISEAWKDFPKWEFWQKVIGKASTMWKQFKFWVQNVAVDWTCSTHLFPWGSIALSRCNTCTLWKQKFQRRRAHNTCTYVCNTEGKSVGGEDPQLSTLASSPLHSVFPVAIKTNCTLHFASRQVGDIWY